MKRLIFIACLLFSSSVFSGGVYDGIWDIKLDGEIVAYTTVNQQNNIIIAVFLDTSSSDVDANLLFGYIDDNQNVPIETIEHLNNIDIRANLVFNSTSSATYTQTSCKPKKLGYRCAFSDGTVLELSRIW